VRRGREVGADGRLPRRTEGQGSARSVAGARIDVPRGIGTLFSCSHGERAFESEKDRHGVFFHFVLEGRAAGRRATGG
jgi:hypothetical protein